MEKFSFILLFILASTGCQPDTPSKSEVAQDYDPCHGMVDIKKWQAEILDIDSIFIDGTTSVMLNVSELVAKFGPPRQTLRIDRKAGFLPYMTRDTAEDKAFSLFFGDTVFDRIGDSVIVNVIDFRSTNVSMAHPKLSLRRGLHVKEVCDVFPESCKLVVMSGNTWSGHIELRASEKGLDPRRWFLVFQNEELIKLDLHTLSRL
jgi:hypothetical protein